MEEQRPPHSELKILAPELLERPLQRMDMELMVEELMEELAVKDLELLEGMEEQRPPQ